MLDCAILRCDARVCQMVKMLEDARRGRYTEAEIEARLADAGRTLLALPWVGCFPLGFKTLWPEAEAAASGTRPAPTSQQISAMDQAYSWTALIAKPDERRMVLMRSLMLSPSATGRPRYVWSWRRLRKTTGLHSDTLKKHWARGIAHIVVALNRSLASTVSDRSNSPCRIEL